MPDNEIYIKVTKDGPYLVYGIKTIVSQIILTDENGIAMEYGNGETFKIKTQTSALCRCGKSKNPPFCDNTHSQIHFDGTETASFEPILKNSTMYEGPELTLADNEIYCASARFCDANGTIWNLIHDKFATEEVKRQARLCPAGRLIIFDKEGNLIEENLPKSINVLEDDGLKISGPIWVRGGIRVESADGKSYEIRNRQTLCRCGKSKNKPFCDSTHCHINFKTQK